MQKQKSLSTIVEPLVYKNTKKKNCPPLDVNRVVYPPIKPYRAFHLEMNIQKTMFHPKSMLKFWEILMVFQ